LLIEEQRTNLATYSQDFSNAAWVKGSITLTSGIADPAGGTTAFTVTATAANGFMYKGNSTTAGAHTGSIYIRRRTGSGAVRLGLTGSSPYVDLTVTPVWTRVSITQTVASTTGYLEFIFTTSGDQVDIWGAQLEAGAFATSYIPTMASQVTRAADSASMIGNNFARWYNAEGGTVYSEFSRDSTSGASRGVWAINSGATNNAIDYRPNGSNCVVQVSGATQADIYPGGGTAGAVVKNAFAFRLNDFAASTNAGTVQTDTSGSLPIASQMQVGGLSTSAGQLLCGTIKRITYYPRRLANSELIGITS
jgi:hypothetical protein